VIKKVREVKIMNRVWEKTLRAGEKWSGAIGRGKLIKFTALEAGANVSLLFYNQRDLTERYNMPDTLKAQHTAMLTKGNVLMSDNGRVLASIVEDSLGWHDTISGLSTREAIDAKYGKSIYQLERNDCLKSGYENFAVELIRSGLGLRDLVPNVNLFSKVKCNAQGEMLWASAHCKKGDTITLRTEMDVLMIVSNTPHALEDSEAYPIAPVHMEVMKAEGVDEADYCLNFRPENHRAFENTWDYYKLLD